MTQKEKNLDYYLQLNYPYNVTEDDGEIFINFPDLPGCMTQVENASEIHSAANEIKELWLETAFESGNRIPEPIGKEFSGKFVTRVPKSLHHDLVHRARREGMSLNTYITYKLTDDSRISKTSGGEVGRVHFVPVAKAGNHHASPAKRLMWLRTARIKVSKSKSSA